MPRFWKNLGNQRGIGLFDGQVEAVGFRSDCFQMPGESNRSEAEDSKSRCVASGFLRSEFQVETGSLWVFNSVGAHCLFVPQSGSH